MGTIKKFQVFLVFFLSALMPGLGSFYVRRSKTAAVIYSAGILLICSFWWGVFRTFIGLLLWIVAIAFFYTFNLATARHSAIRAKKPLSHHSNRWAFYLAAGFLHAALFLLMVFHLGLPIKIYHTPTASMTPALMPGDYFLIEKRSNGASIQREEIIVFSSPTNEKIDYVKRVVGLPGEVIEMVRREVWINGQKLKEAYRVKDPDNGPLYGRSHYGPLIVPKDAVYVLGDNRSHSADSRQYKAVKQETIKGRALYVVWSKEKMRIGRSLR
jgi:signal peptidase I